MASKREAIRSPYGGKKKRERGDGTGQQSGCPHLYHFAQHQPDHAAARGAERNADADLAGSPGHGVSHDAVESYGSP